MALFSPSGGGTANVSHGNTPFANMQTGTVLIWAKPANTSNSLRVLVGHRIGSYPNYQGWLLYRPGTDGTQLRFNLHRASTDMSVYSTSGVITTSWQFVAVTWDIADTGRLYRGTLTQQVTELAYGQQTAGSGAQNNDSSANLLAFNVQSDGGPLWAFPGDIGLIAIYPNVLTLAEIEAQRRSLYPTKHNFILFSHYGFAGLAGDWSGNAYNGTVSGSLSVSNHIPLPIPILSTQGSWIAAPITIAYSGIGRQKARVELVESLIFNLPSSNMNLSASTRWIAYFGIDYLSERWMWLYEGKPVNDTQWEAIQEWIDVAFREITG